jgi:diguanylate cyclase (GGDEF)-like protein/PAS domain S-box-containing protein
VKHNGPAVADGSHTRVAPTGTDPASVDALCQIHELLRTRPSARVLAGAADSRPMPVPQNVPVARDKCLPAHVLDTLNPADFEPLIDALARCRSTGWGRARVHFSLPDAEIVTIDMFDTLGLFDVVLCVLTLDDDESTFLDRLANHDVAAPRRRLTQDAVGVIVNVDDGLEQLLGYAAGDLRGRRSTDLVHPEDYAHVSDSWREMMREPSHPRLERLRYRGKDGSYLWFEVLQANRLESDGVIVWTFTDVSGEIAAQQRVAEREQLLHQITESLPLGVMQVDAAGAVRHTNRRLAAVLGFAVVAHIDEIGEYIEGDDKDLLTDALKGALGGADVDVRVTLAPRHERVRVCEVNLRALDGEGGAAGVLVCFTEVTESVRLQRQLEEQATHDSLTGCLNRRAILSFLEEQLAGEDGAQVAALFIDLDLFKMANDRHGHAAGDEMLSAVGSRLTNLLRPGDAVGRIGGDEFLAVFRDVATLAEAQKLGHRVATALSSDIRIAGAAIPSSASVGVSWSAEAAVTAEEMVARADAAMYAAKSTGGRASVVHQVTGLPRQLARGVSLTRSEVAPHPS